MLGLMKSHNTVESYKSIYTFFSVEATFIFFDISNDKEILWQIIFITILYGWPNETSRIKFVLTLMLIEDK